MKRRPVPDPQACPALLRQRDELGEHEFARRIFEYLCDDAGRSALYAALRDAGGVLRLQSLATHDEEKARPAAGAELDATVYLLANRHWVQSAFVEGHLFSNVPYAPLGSGDFLLSLDPQSDDQPLHDAQKTALFTAFHGISTHLPDIAAWASRAARLSRLGRDDFDLAVLAEQAALRFGQAVFGLATQDLLLLAAKMPVIYRAMTHQMFARHFVAEPSAVPAGRTAMAELVTRCGQLMKDYALGAPEWPEGLERPGDGLPHFTPVLKALATGGGALHGMQRAVIVVGALAGMIGNIQAGSCIALRWLLDAERIDKLVAARRVAQALGEHGDPKAGLWQDFILPALRSQPPAPFLPRRTLQAVDGIPKGADCILCVGAATAEAASDAEAAALMFGLEPGPSQTGLHWCLGAELARVMISRIVGDVLRLAGLDEQLDTRDGLPIGLLKRWGYACERFPLRYRRDQHVAQQPLNAAYRVRHPAHEHAPKLRDIIRHGAARIERVLRESRHVHFAWFQFLEDDHLLVLHTVFDGDFDAYLQHFALVVDDLFDALFEHLEDAPPRPVADHPEEFVASIRTHHRAATEDFFFSAYPQTTTPQIVRAGALK